MRQQAREVDGIPGARVNVPLHRKFAHGLQLAPVALPVNETSGRRPGSMNWLERRPFLTNAQASVAPYPMF